MPEASADIFHNNGCHETQKKTNMLHPESRVQLLLLTSRRKSRRMPFLTPSRSSKEYRPGLTARCILQEYRRIDSTERHKRQRQSDRVKQEGSRVPGRSEQWASNKQTCFGGNGED